MEGCGVMWHHLPWFKKPAWCSRGRFQESDGSSTLSSQFEAMLDQDSRKFVAVLVIIEILYMIGYGIMYVFQLVKLNSMPLATTGATLALHLLCFSLYFNRVRQPFGMKPRWVAAATTPIVCMLLAIARPDVQAYVLEHISFLRLLGPAASCHHVRGGCVMKDDSLTDFFMHSMLVFVVLFVLNVRQGLMAAVIGVISYFTMIHATTVVFSPVLSMLRNVMMLLSLLFIIAAKRQLEWHQFNLFLQLRQQEKEVVKERVLRYKAEFQKEQLVANGCQQSKSSDVEHDLYSSSSLSCGKETQSSGQVFETLREQEPDMDDEALPKLATIGNKEHWLVDCGALQLKPNLVIGSGSYGKVILASFFGSLVAAKVQKMTFKDGRFDVVGRSHGLSQLANELRTLRHLKHPNIATLLGACVDHSDGGRLVVVLEYVQGTTLSEFTRQDLGEAQRGIAMLEVCCALWYLHSSTPPIVHGDLKPANVMMEPHSCRVPPWNHRVKLLDFGLSRVLSNHNYRPLGGTVQWMAPELFRSARQKPLPSPMADVFGFGRLMYFIITGCKPLGKQSTRVIEFVAKLCSPSLSWPPSQIVEQCQPIAEHCMAFDAGQRPTMAEVHEQLLEWAVLAAACQQREEINGTANSSQRAEGALTPHQSQLRAPWGHSLTMAELPRAEAELLSFRPKKRLTLHVPDGSSCPRAQLTVKNQRSERVAFQVSAGPGSFFEILPNQGTLGPHSQQVVTISLPVLSAEFDASESCVVLRASPAPGLGQHEEVAEQHSKDSKAWMLPVVFHEQESKARSLMEL